MNLVLVTREEIEEGGFIRLDDRRAQHLVDVVGITSGDSVRIGVVRGARGTAEVASVAGGVVTLVARSLQASATSPPPPAIDLVLAIPRPKVVSRALRAAAAAGVRRVDLVNAWRVDRSYLSSPRLDPERLAHDLVLGCEQGATTWVPDVEVHRFFVDGVAAAASRLEDAVGVALHPRGARPLEEVVRPGERRRVAVALGPEGGWIERELDSLEQAGFVRASLGDAILRVESAVAAALAQIDLLRRLPGRR